MTPREEVERAKRMVEKTREGYVSKFLSPEVAIILLLRELAKERARVRRIVNNMPCCKSNKRKCETIAPQTCSINRHDLLAALRGRKVGGKR